MRATIDSSASLNLLKFLANDLKFSIVLIGPVDAPLALATDPQMISRFQPFGILRWRESDDLRRPLWAFARVLRAAQVFGPNAKLDRSVCALCERQPKRGDIVAA